MGRTSEKLREIRAARAAHDISIYGDDDDAKQSKADTKQSKLDKARMALAILNEGSDRILNKIDTQQQTRQAAEDAKAKAKALSDANIDLLNAKAMLAKADVDEKDKNGPLHRAAQKMVIDAQAKRDGLVDAALAPPAPASAPSDTPKDSDRHKGGDSGVPTWVWYAVGAVGVAGVGLLGYKLIKGK